MNEKSLSRWRIVTLITTTVAFLFAVTYALTGYIVFGQQTEGDLLENYCHWDTLINIARLIYAINIMLTFPLECLVCRQVIEIVYSKWTNLNSIRNHYIITSFIVTASVILSLATDCLGIVLELNGLLVASSLAYILPALCYLKLKSNTSHYSFDNICPYILLIIGILLTLSGFILPLRHALQEGYYCQHGIEPRYCTHMFSQSRNFTTPKNAIKLSIDLTS
jgi:sodium-coupled neutral amino acid transporter 11